MAKARLVRVLVKGGGGEYAMQSRSFPFQEHRRRYLKQVRVREGERGKASIGGVVRRSVSRRRFLEVPLVWTKTRNSTIGCHSGCVVIMPLFVLAADLRIFVEVFVQVFVRGESVIMVSTT